MDIGAILSRAWEILKRHKVLWIFGILAGCGSANTGSSGSGIQYEGNAPPGLEQFFNQVPDWQVALIVGIIILVALVLIVLAIFLSTVGRIGIIRGVQQAEAGRDRLEFGELFNGSLPYFWRVFGLNLVVILLWIVVGLAIAVLAVPLAITVVGLFCLIPLICLLVPLGWFVGVIVEQATVAIVVDELGIMEGLQRGWDTVRNNLGEMIVMALILYLGVGLIGGFIIGLPLVLVAGPAIFSAAAGSQAAMSGGFLVAGLCLVAYLPVLIVLNGILQTYIKTSWALTYMRLTGRAAAIPAASPAPVE